MTTYKSPISIDLLDRAERSDSFPKDWSTSKRLEALRRYERFLLLAKKHPGVALAPTRDIDEMWHLHMLSPCAYFDDCEALFGDLPRPRRRLRQRSEGAARAHRRVRKDRAPLAGRVR